MRVKYILVALTVITLVVFLFLAQSSRGVFQLKHDEVVYPQIDMSFNFSADASNTIVLKIAESIANLHFLKKSSLTDSKHTKRWAEKGMVEMLWSRNDKDFVSIDNLLNQSCYNLRVYTIKGKGDAENITSTIINDLKKELGELSFHSDLNCKQ
jgi:hypothetical protein